MIAEHELKDIPTIEENLWNRSGTTIEPATAGDDVDMGTGDVSGVNGNFSGKLTVGGLIDPTGLVLDGQASAPSTADGTIYYNSVSKKFIFREDGKDIDIFDSPLIFQGSIALASDFPTTAYVETGYFYVITANVTDNDPTKTNTGQSFLAGDEIVWNGTDWSDIGSTAIWTDDGTDITPVNTGRNIDIGTGGLKDNDVTTALPLGDASNTSIDSDLGGDASILAGINAVTDSQAAELGTGFGAWTSAGNYISSVNGGSNWSVELLRSGNGYIDGKKITFTAASAGTISYNTTSYLFITSAGAKSLLDYSAVDDDTYRDNICLFGFFEYYDDTLPTRRNYQFKASYPYGMNTVVQLWHQNYINAMISGTIVTAREASGLGGSADDRKWGTTTGDTVSFRGLSTDISIGSPKPITQMYLNGSSNWVQYRYQSEIVPLWNNAGTATAATNGKYLLFPHYVTLDGLDNSSPRFWTVIQSKQYDTLQEIYEDIKNDAYDKPTGAFDAVPLAKVLFVIMLQNAAGGYIYSIIPAIGAVTAPNCAVNRQLIEMNYKEFDINVISKSASANAALVDNHKVIEFANAANNYTYTLQPDSTLNLPIGTWIEVRKTGAGDITLTRGGGVTFRGVLGNADVKLDGQDGYSAFIEKTATDTWLVTGAVKA